MCKFAHKNKKMVGKDTISDVARESKVTATGDSTDLKSLYKKYFRVLTAYAMKIVRDEHEAEDIVQEVFARLWARREKLYDHYSLMTLIYTSVRNLAIDRVKHQAVEKAYQEGVSMEAATDLEAEMFAGEVYTRLFEYIDRLPCRQRTTILLAMEGKKNAEIAEEMQLSVETVKRHKHSAIETLREVFRREQQLALLPLLELMMEY